MDIRLRQEVVSKVYIKMPFAAFCLALVLVLVSVKNLAYAQSNSVIKRLEVVQLPFRSKIEFPLDKTVSAAAYIRGNTLWILFDKYIEFQLPDIASIDQYLLDKNEAWIKGVKQFGLNDKFSFYAFTLSIHPGRNLVVNNKKVGDNWFFELVANDDNENSNITILSKHLSSQIPGGEAILGENSEIIHFTDPIIGDNLAVIPLSQANRGISYDYDYPDFRILKSLQGIVVEKKSDVVDFKLDMGTKHMSVSDADIFKRVFKSNNGIRKSENRFKFSKLISDDISIFNLRSFYVEPAKFNYYRYLIWQSLLNVSQDKRSKIYAHLALFYLAHDFYKEAAAVIDTLEIVDFDTYQSYEAQLIKVVGLFMDTRYKDAFDIVQKMNISEIPIPKRKEIRFWQALLGHVSGKSDDLTLGSNVTYIFKNAEKQFLAEYTDPVIRKIGIILMDILLKQKNLSEAGNVLDILLDNQTLTPHETNTVNYLAGKFYMLNGKEKRSIEYFDKCIDDIKDSFNRTRCRFEKAKYQFAQNRIRANELLQELEPLPYIWRGDGLEMEILEYLGDRYKDEKMYSEALRAWIRIVERDPKAIHSLSIREKMSNSFKSYFLDDIERDPVDALSTFYEFKDLVSIGEMGDYITLKFSDYLIKLDLLDRATALLNHQVKNRLTGINKELVTNKLANLYLLNNKPHLALQVFELINSEVVIPPEAEAERKYIKAKALLFSRQYDEALKLLQGDQSQQADDIKADIYWKQNKWKEFNDYSEPYLYLIRDQSYVLDDEEVVRVLKQTISYVMLGRMDLLKELYFHFKNRIPEKNYHYQAIKFLIDTAFNHSANELKGLWNVDQFKQGVEQIIKAMRLSPDRGGKENAK